MRKSVAAMVAVALTSIPHSQAEESAYKAPLVEKSVLLDIAANDYVVIVGERGHILTSTDGKTFTQQDVPTTSTLTGVAIIGDKVWAVGHDAVILYSDDKGANWTTQFYHPEFERPFLDVAFFDELNGIAVGAYGMFYRTTDGGKSWSSERHEGFVSAYDKEFLEELKATDMEAYEEELGYVVPTLNSLSIVGENVYATGGGGMFAVSNDKGHSWTRYDIEYEGSFFGGTAINGMTPVTVGLRGNVFFEQDNQWVKFDTCDTATLNTIIEHQDNIYALGNNGVIITLPKDLENARDTSQSTRCKDDNVVSVNQLEDKSAILNAITFNGQTIAVTADGIKQLNLD